MGIFFVEVNFSAAGFSNLKRFFPHPQRQRLWGLFEPFLMCFEALTGGGRDTDVENRNSRSADAVYVPVPSVVGIGLYQTTFIPLDIPHHSVTLVSVIWLTFDISPPFMAQSP